MRSVIIIDDDQIHQRIAQMLIEKNNLFDKLQCYTFAGDALDLILTNKNNPHLLPDVILLDLNMPVTNGWEFLNTYSQMVSQLAKISEIFIVSSSVDENDKLKSLDYPFVKAFISKPMSSDLLNSFLKVQSQLAS